MDDFIQYADEEETEKMNDYWEGMKNSATEFGKSRGVVDGGDRWVNIHGLQSEAGKKLNGKFGLVLKKEPNDEGRYQVQVHGIRDIKLIKGSNIKDIDDSELVRVYRIGASGEEGSKHQVLLFPKIHPMFQSRDNAPALALCGLPLVVKKTKTRTKLVNPGDYDCQWATWLMIDPVTGLAPMEWQSFVGPVLVFRPGGKDLSADDMDVTIEFVSALLDEFGEGDPGFDPRTWLNPAKFQRFVRKTIREREMSSGGSKLEGLTILEN